MSGYPYQAAERDASVSVDMDREQRMIVIEVAAGSCVTVSVPLYLDEARGLLADLAAVIKAVEP